MSALLSAIAVEVVSALLISLIVTAVRRFVSGRRARTATA
ncbi:hypothetical protein GCM10010170_015220 [Dactylosporangium salmoneum]|uniref:Uncharacterized protein n=1 Tax=Dactylosporangium salmoneum TaxID=53361 RepID=A0ABP5SNJ3_9ACTN